MTYFTDVEGHTHTALGVCEHYSRLSLALRRIPIKASVALLRALLDIVEVFGAPQVVRTDNEAVFTSQLFRIGLRLMGIRHQTIVTFRQARLDGCRCLYFVLFLSCHRISDPGRQRYFSCCLLHS